MTRDGFWELVARTLRDAEQVPSPRRGLLRRPVHLRPGRRHVLATTALLTALPDDDLVAFQGHLDALRADAFRWDLWGAGHVACGGLGDDAFLDLRTWLVSQGRDAWERVLSAPDALALVAPPDLPERLEDAELWGYAALEVWDGRHDDDMPRPEVRPPGEPAGEPWSEDELPGRYPRLTARWQPGA